MRGCIGLAVTGMMLFLAFPAAAEERRTDIPEYKRFGPTLTQRERGPLLPDLDRRFSFSTEDFIREDGSAATRTRMIGSLPVAEGFEIGVGLFSIIGQTEKEMVRRRTDPARDVRTKDGRMAAVGVSMRF